MSCVLHNRLFINWTVNRWHHCSDRPVVHVNGHHCCFDIIEGTDSCCRLTGLYRAYNELHVCCKWRAVFQCVLYSVGAQSWSLRPVCSCDLVHWRENLWGSHNYYYCLPLCLSSVIQMCFHLEESLCSVLHRFFFFSVSVSLPPLPHLLHCLLNYLLRQRWSFSPPICLEFPAPLCLHHTGGDRTSWAPFDSAGFTIHLHLSQHTKHTFTLSSKASAASAWEYSLSLSTRGEETPGSLCFWHMLCLHPQLSALSLDSHISDQTQRKCSPRFRWTLTKHWPTSQCLCTTVCYWYDHIRLYDPAVMF